MGISSAGIGSGLDVNGLISQLMAIERQPLDSLNTKKTTYNSQLSAFGQIRSSLDAFKTAVSNMKLDTAFAGTTATSSNTSILTATSASGSVPGNYTITVSSLAQAGVKASAGQTSSSAGIGSGNLTSDPASISFSAGGKSFNVSVTATDSLESIRDKINNAVATGDTASQTVAKATIVNAGTSASPSYKLVVSATATGVDNDVSITVNDAKLNTYLGFSTAQPAANAKLNINGLDIQRSSNTISDAIDGVTLNLASADATKPVGLTVGRDKAGITALVNSFISAYNQLSSTVTNLHQKGGTLEADNSATSVIYSLQSVFNQPANISGNSYQYLAQVGISFDKNGKLTLDSTKFSAALDSNFNNVVSLFTDSNSGYASRLYNAAEGMLETGGLVASRISGINTRINSIDDQIDQENLRLTATEARLRTQYSNLDAMLGTMKNNAGYLSKL